MKQNYKESQTDLKKQSMKEVNKNYKKRMKELMPEQFSEETLVERIEQRIKKAKKEHSDNKDLAISQFWYGQWRAMEWILEEMKSNDNV